MHTVIHPDCYERLAAGLGLDFSARRLKVPKFFHNLTAAPKINSETTPTGPKNLLRMNPPEFGMELDDFSVGAPQASLRLPAGRVSKMMMASV